MKNRFLVLLLGATLFVSCQKEITITDVDPNNSGGTTGNGGPANAAGITGGTNGTLLLRGVRKTGNDSVVSTLTYNSADKFISYTAIGKEKIDTSTIVFNIQKYYTRDAAGRITNIVSPNTMDTSILGPADSTRSVVYYPSPSSTEFNTVVTKTDAILMKMTDSTVYTYSGGRVIRWITYNSNDFLSVVPTITAKGEYDYDPAGNVAEVRQYSQSQTSSGLELVAKTNYTFDNHPNVHYFKNEGFLIGDIYYGPNNNLSATQISYTQGQTNRITSAYNYNSNNVPKNGQMVLTPPYRVSTLTFYYR